MVIAISSRCSLVRAVKTHGARSYYESRRACGTRPGAEAAHAPRSMASRPGPAGAAAPQDRTAGMQLLAAIFVTLRVPGPIYWLAIMALQGGRRDPSHIRRMCGWEGLNLTKLRRPVPRRRLEGQVATAWCSRPPRPRSRWWSAPSPPMRWERFRIGGENLAGVDHLAAHAASGSPDRLPSSFLL